MDTVDYQRGEEEIMNKIFKKFVLPLVILTLIVSLTFTAPVFAADDEELKEAAKASALSFLRDVLFFIDLEKYNVTFYHYSFDYAWDWGENTFEQGVHYYIKSPTHQLRFSIHFCNQTPYYVILNDEYQKAVLFPEFDSLTQSNRLKIIQLAKTLVNRYQKWKGDLSLKAAADILSMVNATETTTKTVGSLNFTANWKEDSVSFSWVWQVNGVSAGRLGFTLDRSGLWFSDNRAIYKLGSTDVKVSKEEAIAIALKRVETFSYKARIDLNTSVEVKDFVVVKDKITAELLTWPKEPLVLYPYWSVKLGLDTVYPAFVDAIHVGIWADTGEVFFCEPIGWGGPVSADGSGAETQPEGDVGDGEAAAGQTWQTSAIVVAAAVVTATVLGVAVLKRKRKQ